MVADWIKIKNEYVNTSISYRKLAEKYEVSFPTLRDRAKKEEWSSARAKQRDKISTVTLQKTAEKIATSEANRIARLLSLSDKLTAQIDRAIDELDNRVVTNKHKTRVIEYTDEDAPGKPTKETISEIEDCAVVQTLIDRQGLQQISVALKNIKDTITVLDAGDEEVADDGFLDALNAQASDMWDATAPDDSADEWETAP